MNEPDRMLYEKCPACERMRTIPPCVFCRGVGYVQTGATAGQLERLAEIDTLRQNAGIKPAMLSHWRDMVVALKDAMHQLTGENEDGWMESQSHSESPYHYLYLAITKAKGN